MPDLHVVAGHRFVHAEFGDRAAVVFAQERGGLFRGPVVGNRRHRVERSELDVERARRIAIRDGHAALELRHQDHLHGRIGQGDEVLRTDEIRRLREFLLRGIHSLVACGPVVGGEVERSLDRLLLLRVGWFVRRRWRASLASKRLSRDGVHLRAHGYDLGLGALADVGARHRRIQRECELLVVELLADPEVALRVRHQGLVQPGLLFGDGLAQVRNRCVETLAVGIRQFLRVRHQHVVDDAEHARVLFRDGLRVDQRHPRWVEARAGLHEQFGQFFHARGRAAQAIRPRCEVARSQRVQRAAGDAVVDLRIPGPALQLFGSPDVVAQLVVQHRRIDLVIARELAAIDLAQFGEHLF